ncbi:DUF421 domain-containing protein [Clostridium cadaveris]
MFIFLVRTAILYALIVLIMRLMGKRQVGELEPYELVIAFIISDLATLPMQDIRMPLINGITPIITILIMQIGISWLQFKNRGFRKIVDGQAVVLIKKGVVNVSQLKAQQLTINELLEELRGAGYLDLSEVEYGLLETNGKLTVVPSKEYNNKSLPKVVFCNGQFYEDNLAYYKKNKNWVHEELHKNNLTEKDIDFAIIDSNKSLFYQKKEERLNE